MAVVAIDIRVLGQKRTGDETVFLEITRALLQEPGEHQYLLLTQLPESKAQEVLSKLLGYSTNSWPDCAEVVSLAPGGKFLWNAWILPRFLRSRTVDVLHTQYIIPFFVPRTTELVAHVHDISFARLPEYISWKDRFFLWVLMPRTFRKATVVAPSVFTKNEICAVYGVPEEQIVVAYNALKTSFHNMMNLPVDEQRKTAVQRKYQLPDAYFLYVGTLQPRKNIPFLLEAFAQVCKQSNAKLVLVGRRDGHNYDHRIDVLLEELGLEKRVVFPGYVDETDLPVLYKGAKAFIFPSRYEGFGLPLLEALALGVPTLASDIAVHHEVGGEYVKYFSLADIAPLAQMLYTDEVESGLLAICDMEAYMKNKGFAWKKTASVLRDLYATLAPGHKK